MRVFCSGVKSSLTSDFASYFTLDRDEASSSVLMSWNLVFLTSFCAFASSLASSFLSSPGGSESDMDSRESLIRLVSDDFDDSYRCRLLLPPLGLPSGLSIAVSFRVLLLSLYALVEN